MGIKIVPEEKNEKVIFENLPSTSGQWIKQPWTFTFVAGSMSLMQLNIMVSLIQSLQKNINDLLHKKTSSLFPDEAYNEKGEIEVKVLLSDVTDTPENYGVVENAAIKLLSISYSYDYKEKNGSISVERRNLFNAVRTPKDKSNRREGYITFLIGDTTVQYVLEDSKYTNYLRGILDNFKKEYAARLYMYIKAWSYTYNADKGYGTWKIEYTRLREMLGCRVWESPGKDTRGKDLPKIWVEKKYPMYYKFKEKVLETARQELDALAKENKVECYFTYEEDKGKKAIYECGPERILFKIYLTEFGKQQKDLLDGTSAKCRIEAILRNELNLQTSQVDSILKLVRKENSDFLLRKLEEMKGYLLPIEDMTKQEKYIKKGFRAALKLRKAGIEDDQEENAEECVDYEEVKSDTVPSSPAPEIIENRCTEAVMKYWKHLIPQKEHSNYPEVVNELINLLDNGLQLDLPGYDISKLDNHLMSFCTSFADYPTPAAILNFIKVKEGIPVVDYGPRTSSRYSSGIEYTHLDPRRAAPCPTGTSPSDYE